MQERIGFQTERAKRRDSKAPTSRAPAMAATPLPTLTTVASPSNSRGTNTSRGQDATTQTIQPYLNQEMDKELHQRLRASPAESATQPFHGGNTMTTISFAKMKRLFYQKGYNDT